MLEDYFQVPWYQYINRALDLHKFSWCGHVKMMFYLLCVFLLISSTRGEDWKTCDDVPFCRTIRNENGNTGRFVLLPETILESDTGFQAALENTENGKHLDIKVTSLIDETFRIVISDPQNRRFASDVALNAEPTSQNVTVLIQDAAAITLSTEYGRVTVSFNPFTVVVVQGGNNVLYMNTAGRMVYNTEGDDVSIALDVTFPLAKRAYGIPEHAERLSLKTTSPGGLNPYRLFNVDYYGYPVGTQEALYGSIPVLYGVSNTTTAGVFWMNAAQTFVEIDNTADQGVNTLFMSEAGLLDIFLFSGPTLKDSVRQFTRLTGVTPLPQYFTLGYHQSRYSYMNQSDVETVVAEFDNHDFPMDVIWLDIDYTDGYKYFTWNYTAFPDPIQMQNNIVDTGRKVVAIIDPHKKVEEGYHVYDQAKENGFFVKNPDGTVFEGMCWPGLSSYVDFFNPEASEWYSRLYLLENWNSTTLDVYVWNDMNEPSVFEIEEQTMPGNLAHYGDWLHRDLHNLYGFKQTEATRRGLLERHPNRRPFVLTRAHFAGSQRYAAMWTGDNNPTWEHLQISVPMLLTQSLAGMSFCGCDIGGFTGNVEEDLLQRWYQAGAWYPFYRGHSGDGTDRREPYLFSDEVQTRIRTALRQRYAHIPQWYSLWFQHETTMEPVMRSLSYEYPSDINTLDIDDQWFIGSSILVSPVLEQDATTRKIYLPGGPDFQWIEINRQEVFFGGNIELDVTMDSVPVFYKSGHIIFRHNVPVPSTAFGRDYPYSAHIFCGSEDTASGYLYVDDFESFNYRNGEYTWQLVEHDCTTNTLKITSLNDKVRKEFVIMDVVVYKATSERRNGGLKAEKTVFDVKLSSKTIGKEMMLKL